VNELKTIDIKGKDYVLVHERIKYFRAIYPGYALVTTPVRLDESYCVMKAEIFDHRGNIVATGYAREVNGDSYINKTSYVENCETSAWGRALANFGIGVDSSVASADEVMNAMQNQHRKNGNGNGQQTRAQNLSELMKQAHADYVKEHADDIPEHFVCDFDLFKTEVRAEVKKKFKTVDKLKEFAWTPESIKPFVDKVDITKALRETNADA